MPRLVVNEGRHRGEADEALNTVAKASKGEVQEFLDKVFAAVRWQDYSDIPYDSFVLLKLLNLMDVWSSYEDEEKSIRLRLEVEDLEPLRLDPNYQVVQHALKEAHQKARVPQTFEKLVNKIEHQDAAFYAAKRLIGHEDGRIAERALQQFTDRMAPVKRGNETVPQVVIQFSDFERLQSRTEELRKLGVFDKPLEIEGKVEPL
jgi:hypothetical protein